MYDCSKHFRKKGIAYVNNNAPFISTAIVDRSERYTEGRSNPFIYGICYSYWKSNVSSCCHEHKITHALLPLKCEIRQKKINMTKHGDSPLPIAV